jgi:hypothetical protein
MIRRNTVAELRGHIAMCDKWFAAHGRQPKRTDKGIPVDQICRNAKENHARAFVNHMRVECEAEIKRRYTV